MSLSDTLLRFSIAFSLALAYGLARQRMGKPIGFGTFILVALGACALSLTAVHLAPENPLPLMTAIVTGIGFLGAGALFRASDRVIGFTSAATIWVFAVFGLTVGAGEFLVAGLLYGSIAAVTVIDTKLERHWIGAYRRSLTIEVPHGTGDEALERELGLPPRMQAGAVHGDREAGTLSLTYSIRRPRGEARDLLDRLERSALVVGYRVD